MEDQLAQLLSATQASTEAPRKQAEAQLQSLYATPDFPFGLVAVASHESVPLNIRQAALLCLKRFVLAVWSDQFDEFNGCALLPEESRTHIRAALLDLSTNAHLDPKLQTAASSTVSKIASVEFPEHWPDLLPRLMQLIPVGSDGQIHGALRVLNELVDDCFSQEQFFTVARELVQVVYNVATNESRKPTLRALALAVFKSCVNILEMILENHKADVKAFADEVLNDWNPFFIQIMKARLPSPPSEAEEEMGTPGAEAYRGLVALKLQVVKVLMRIRSVFPSILSPQSRSLFSATWEELNALQPSYHQMYIEEDRQSRLEDPDGLPYTLDFLVLEDLDFMQACLRAPPVRTELEQQLRTSANPQDTWITKVMELAVAYAQITTEEEGLWNFDVNVFLSEETSVTANYTPRTACGDLVIKLGDWLSAATVEALLTYTRSLYNTAQSWKAKEAALFILNQLLGDLSDLDRTVEPEAAIGFVACIRYAMEQPDAFLRARGFLVAGSLIKASGDVLREDAANFLQFSLQAITVDKSDVVQVSCIRALQFYIQALPKETTQPLQIAIISALSNYLQTIDLEELADADDLMVTLVETLRDAILLDPLMCLTGSGLDVLFTVASRGAVNFQLVMLVNETFEEVAASIARSGGDAYIHLCEKVLPSLTGAFDVGSLTEENALTSVGPKFESILVADRGKLAADLLAILAEKGSEPLPQGFVQATMPKLSGLLLAATDDELLKAATMAVKNIIIHDHKQLFEWRDETGKGGLQVVFAIIGRLLSPAVDDQGAAEVGSLAAEVVEKAGYARLGPHLPELLQAVAVRLESAVHAQFIQSLTLVFARLSRVNAKDVVDFLAQQHISGKSALHVVLTQWLENSINFVGYDEIRQNVIALSKLYELGDPRVAQIHVKGDLIIPDDGRIMTRSRARTNPDQYTIVPAPLKILKVLIVELSSASGNGQSLDDAGELAAVDDDTDDGSWEDEPNFLPESSTGMSKDQLLGFANDAPTTNSAGARQKDDETQAFLVGFFQRAALDQGFQMDFETLTEQEQERLRSMGTE